MQKGADIIQPDHICEDQRVLAGCFRAADAVDDLVGDVGAN